MNSRVSFTNLTNDREKLTPRAEAAQKADQVFLPVLENASKVQKLVTTLGIFERSKFFFNLPSSLVELIKSVRWFPSPPKALS
jgi:hypothetical protein